MAFTAGQFCPVRRKRFASHLHQRGYSDAILLATTHPIDALTRLCIDRVVCRVTTRYQLGQQCSALSKAGQKRDVPNILLLKVASGVVLVCHALEHVRTRDPATQRHCTAKIHFADATLDRCIQLALRCDAPPWHKRRRRVLAHIVQKSGLVIR